MRPEYIVGIVLLVLVGAGLAFLPSVPTTDAIATSEKKPAIRYKEIVSPSGFVNTNGRPVSIGEYVGTKVVLLEVMTYSCINCQRSFPYAVAWYEKYKDQGLVIIGIHTPEFAFEKNIDNVRTAMQKYNITFPVVLDNDYATWNAYGNRFWPRKYLIDINGNIVYDHIGEGAYDETEAEIVKALNERKKFLKEGGTVTTRGASAVAEVVDFERVKTPETYLGAARIQYLANVPQQSCLSGSCSYTFKNKMPEGYELSGKWKTDSESTTLESGEGAIRIAFTADKVNLVAGTMGKPVRAVVLVDGVAHAEVTIASHDLYNLVDLKGAYGTHVMEIQFIDPGVSAFAFTFG